MVPLNEMSWPDILARPKLRSVVPQLVEYRGQSYLCFSDPLGLAERSALIPQPLAPLLALCDGTRDVADLREGFLLRTGMRLPQSEIVNFLGQLDSAMMLENGMYNRAYQRVLSKYRDAEFRRPFHAGHVYPDDQDGLMTMLTEYCGMIPKSQNPQTSARLVGMVSPHIDYHRGHKTYAELWQRAAPDLQDVDLVIIFGTDHSGGPGPLTLTRQNYATPLGILLTDVGIVDGLADVLGSERAFRDEIHHLREHSIELVSVWLQYFLGGEQCSVVPILCGSFHDFVMGHGDPEEDEAIGAALGLLQEATTGRRTLVIAAGDLAHVGPAFGDPLPLDAISMAKLTAEDNDSMAAICDGDASAFFECSRREFDNRRVCGLSPIYMALRYLETAKGQALGYDQCLADDQGGSVVSIAGVLLYEPA